uniref:Putative D5-like primase /VirE superfamily n=1 Tax=Pithovirus LCPAC304 TaxID=2506594 RepID=A0A481Z7F4_9VIRU|nr:MAG: putative D5-like primase /VirE superfamily [Pithovirus LCPAC304]
MLNAPPMHESNSQNVDPLCKEGENILKKYHSKATKHFHNVVKVVVNGEEHNLVKNKYRDFLEEWGLRKEICIAELPQKVMPFIVDFVFHFKTEDEDCEFFNDDSLIDEFRSICNDVLEKNFRLPDKKRLLISAYLESDTWETNVEGTPLYCMKVRLHFPYCPIEGKLQEEIVIPHIVQQLEESQYILRFFSIEPFYTWKDIVQSPVHEPLELYGSALKASPDADGSVQKEGLPPLEYKGRYGDGDITLSTDPDMPLEKLLFTLSVLSLDVSKSLIIRSTKSSEALLPCERDSRRFAVDESAPTTLKLVASDLEKAGSDFYGITVEEFKEKVKKKAGKARKSNGDRDIGLWLGYYLKPFYRIAPGKRLRFARWDQTTKLWVVGEDNCTLVNDLAKHGIKLIKRYQMEIDDRIDETTSNAALLPLTRALKCYDDLIKKLGKDSALRAIYNRSRIVFQDENFLDNFHHPRKHYLLPLIDVHGKHIVYDHHSKQTRERTVNDFFLGELGATYNPGVNQEKIIEIFDRITARDFEYRDRLQMLFSWFLTQDVSYKILPIFKGDKHNGKSTLVALFARMLGRYLINLNHSAICDQHRNTDLNPALSVLGNNRFVAVIDEVESGASFKVQPLTMVTSGVPAFTCRRLFAEYDDEGEKYRTEKLLLSLNDIPSLPSFGQARDRVQVFPFYCRYFGESDPLYDASNPNHYVGNTYFSKEQDEEFLSAFLQWCMEGFDLLKEGSLTEKIPKAIIEATQEYEEEIDTLSKFLEDYSFVPMETFETQVNDFVSVKDLRDQYKEYADAQKIPMSNRIPQSAFKMDVSVKLCARYKITDPTYKGISHTGTPRKRRYMGLVRGKKTTYAPSGLPNMF